MGIRITDQPGDQHTQNPPPEQDATMGRGDSKTVASVTVDAPGAVPTVLRGVNQSAGFCLIEDNEIGTSTPRASETGHQTGVSETDTKVNQVQVSGLGWVRRDTGATERIGRPEEQIVRKLPPRWTIGPTSGSGPVGGQCNRIPE